MKRSAQCSRCSGKLLCGKTGCFQNIMAAALHEDGIGKRAYSRLYIGALLLHQTFQILPDAADRTAVFDEQHGLIPIPYHFYKGGFVNGL